MKQVALLVVFILASLWMQTSLFPRFFPCSLKPDFFLVLAVYLAFYGDFFRGALASLVLGCAMDGVGGDTLGLYALIYPVLFFTLRGLVSRINTETFFSFYYIVAMATCFEAFLLAFVVFFFSGKGGVWSVVMSGLFFQAGGNLLAAFLVMNSMMFLRRNMAWAQDLSGPLSDENGL